MNKVFRVIWSESQGAWIAVSELVKSHGKRSRKAALALALAATGLMGMSGSASATGGYGDHNPSIGTGSIVIGPAIGGCSSPSAAVGERSVSIGCETGAFAEGDNQTNLGYQAGLGSEGNFNTALGSNAGESVDGSNNTAVGLSSGGGAKGDSNTALGNTAGVSVTGNNNAAVGSNAGGGVTGNDNLSFGRSSGVSTKGDTNVAVGLNAGANLKGNNNASLGRDAGKAVAGSDNAAFGTNAGEGVAGDKNTGFGRSAGKGVKGNSNTSLGDGAGLLQSGNGNLSAGLSAGQSIHGDYNVILGNKSSTVGSSAAKNVNRTVVIGSEAETHHDDTVALGTKAKASHANSVALGNESQTKAAQQIDDAVITTDISAFTGVAGDEVTTTYGGFAGTASGVVSVGSVGAERQITNVAAGAITATSTDALNGSQLFSVATGINTDIYIQGDSVAKSLGGNSSYVGGKVIANLEVGGNTYTNVQDALKGSSWKFLANGTIHEVKAGGQVELAAGDNIEIAHDGLGKATVRTKDDVTFTSVTAGTNVLNATGLKTGDTLVSANGLTFDGSTVAVKSTGINAGDLKITSVKAGTAATDGVNVSQLKGMGDVIGDVTINGDGSITGPTFNVNNTVNNTINEAIKELDKGWKFVAGGASYQVQADDTVELVAGDNIEIAHDGAGKATVKTAENVNFTSVTTGTNVFNAAGLTTGNTFVSSAGLNFTGGSSVAVTQAGINAGGNTISFVGDGLVDSDGVNLGQLKNFTAGAGKGWKLQVDGAPAVNIAPEATVGFNKGKNIVLTQNGTGGVDIATADDVEFDSVKTGDSLLNNAGLKVGSSVFITNQGLQAGNTYVTNAGLSFGTGSVSVAASGINAGGQKITGVQAGTDATDAVNVSQLKGVKDTAEKGWNISTNGGVAQNVAPDGKVDFEAGNNIQLTQNGTNIKVETTPDVTHTSVTTGQSRLDNDGLKVGANVAVTDQGLKAGQTTVTNDGLQVGANVAVTDTGLKAGGTSVTDAGLTFDGSTVAVGAGGINAGGNKIKDVAAGTELTDGVNFGQLKDVEDKVNKGWDLISDGKTSNVGAGGKVSIEGGANIKVNHDGAGNLTIATNPDVTHNSVTTNTVTTGDTVMNDNGITIVGGPSITKIGIDAGDTKITNVKNGDVTSTSTDAVNGSQLNESNIRITKNEGDITNLQTGKDGMFQVSQDYNAPAPKPTGKKSVAGGAGAVASADNSTAIGNDAQATADNSSAFGNSASASANNSVALGHGSVADRENSVSVGSFGKERQITNVARGEVSATSTDAINGSQLHELGGVVNQYYNATNKRIDKVDNNARAGIAGAVAASTLPQSSLPGKSMLTLGGATYRGETALAIGVSRLSDNSRTVIKVNGTADSRGHTSVGVGAGWHW